MIYILFSTFCCHLSPASGRIILKIDTPDRHSIDRGLCVCLCVYQGHFQFTTDIPAGKMFHAPMTVVSRRGKPNLI